MRSPVILTAVAVLAALALPPIAGAKEVTALEVCGTCGVMQTTGDDRWERFFALALEGLRDRTSGRSRRA